MAERTAEQIQREIEQARVSLGATVDQLAERTNPKRLSDQLKQRLLAEAQTTRGKAVIGGAGALVLLVVVRRLRRRSAD